MGTLFKVLEEIVWTELHHDEIGFANIECLVKILRRERLIEVSAKENDICLPTQFIFPHPNIGEITFFTLV